MHGLDHSFTLGSTGVISVGMSHSKLLEDTKSPVQSKHVVSLCLSGENMHSTPPPPPRNLSLNYSEQHSEQHMHTGNELITMNIDVYRMN